MKITTTVGSVCGLLVATLCGYLQLNIAAEGSDCNPNQEARLTTQNNSYDVTGCSPSCSGSCYIVEYSWLNPLKYCASVDDPSRGCRLEMQLMKAASGNCAPPLPGTERCRCTQTSGQWQLRFVNSAENCQP